MSRLQNCDQVLFADMRIALGRGNRCVSEKLLYHSDIGTILQKQSSNRVAQHVRRYMSLDSRPKFELIIRNKSLQPEQFHGSFDKTLA